MNPKELVAQFIEDYLGGADISRLATFPLGNLRNDKVYGCPGRNFDSDDTELMMAIYCLVFGEVWEGLSMDNLGDGKLRGDTLIRIIHYSLSLGTRSSPLYGILMMS